MAPIRALPQGIAGSKVGRMTVEPRPGAGRRQRHDRGGDVGVIPWSTEQEEVTQGTAAEHGGQIAPALTDDVPGQDTRPAGGETRVPDGYGAMAWRCR